MFKEWRDTANHTIRVEHWIDGLEGEPADDKHILRVSVEYINVWGTSTRINSEAWIANNVLTYIYWDVHAWKTDQVPKLTEKVLKLLYEEKRKGTVSRCQ